MPRKRVCPEFRGRFGEYPKILLEAIVRQPPVFGLLTSEAERKRRSDEEEERVRTLFVFKLRLLIKHFDLNWDRPNVLGQLALKLALAHVPGMQIVGAPKRRKGRPKRSIGIRDPFQFLSEVDAIGAEKKIRTLPAIRVWKTRNKSSENEKTLSRRYYLQRTRKREIAAILDVDRERS
jgi:hypothetical protein